MQIYAPGPPIGILKNRFEIVVVRYNPPDLRIPFRPAALIRMLLWFNRRPFSGGNGQHNFSNVRRQMILPYVKKLVFFCRCHHPLDPFFRHTPGKEFGASNRQYVAKGTLWLHSFLPHLYLRFGSNLRYLDKLHRPSRGMLLQDMVFRPHIRLVVMVNPAQNHLFVVAAIKNNAHVSIDIRAPPPRVAVQLVKRQGRRRRIDVEIHYGVRNDLLLLLREGAILFRERRREYHRHVTSPRTLSSPRLRSG